MTSYCDLTSSDIRQEGAWPRLLLACIFSVLLHLMILGVPVNPTGGVTQVISTIQARLEPAVDADGDSAPPPDEPAATPIAPQEPRTEKPATPEAQSKPAPKPIEQPAAKAPSSPSAGIEVPLIRDPVYYPVRQLDVYPQPVAMIQPKCPETAIAQKINGRVQLLVLIDEFGIVNEASIAEAQPAGVFDEAAIQAFRIARFIPAQKQGNPVKSRVLLRVNFLCGDTEAPAR